MFELYIDKEDYEQREKNKKLQLITTSPLIEEFLIDDRPYSQLSDHLGLSIELKYRESYDEIKEVRQERQEEGVQHEEDRREGRGGGQLEIVEHINQNGIHLSHYNIDSKDDMVRNDKSVDSKIFACGRCFKRTSDISGASRATDVSK